MMLESTLQRLLLCAQVSLTSYLVFTEPLLEAHRHVDRTVPAKLFILLFVSGIAVCCFSRL